jgi:outer membrane receptor protein involved in Fe transport
MYKTSLGYKNAVSGDATLTPNESFAFNIQQINWIRDHLWGAYENNDYETDSRFIGSVAPTWKIVDFLTLRGRLSSDLTADKLEFKNATERPLVLYDPSGSYRITNKNYSVYHGDIMLMFDKNITEKFNLAASIGWQGRSESMSMLSSWTDGGLTTENAFLLGASRYNKQTDQNRMELLKTAYLASIDFSYNNYLFLGVTGRQEKSSTLPKGSNTYFYPALNASFIYTDAFAGMPSWYDMGKLRFSYGIVGNAPAPYSANIVYDAGSGGGVSWSTLPGTFGNEALKPEKITEAEIGLENKFFGSRLGFEISLYSRRISDMIIQQPVPVSDGISNMWMNVGEMLNKGVEISINGTPVETSTFRWDIHTNFALNKNKITKLADGIDYLRNSANFGNTGGGLNMRSYVGQPLGDLYANPVRTVEDPSSPYYGRDIVAIEGTAGFDALGYYSTKTGEANQAPVGNINPKMIGGLGTTFTYKNFYIDIMTDFRIGGDVLNSAEHYPTARGVSLKSLDYRDASHGGVSYQYKGQTFDNGIIVPGVIEEKDASGNVTGYRENTIATPADVYHNYTYNWGNSDEGVTYWFSVHENSYWKLRELVLGYNLPKSVIQKIALKNLRISLFGRNLFYIYKTLKNIDPESTNGGTSWGNQAGVGYSSSPTRTFGLSLRASF